MHRYQVVFGSPGKRCLRSPASPIRTRVLTEICTGTTCVTSAVADFIGGPPGDRTRDTVIKSRARWLVSNGLTRNFLDIFASRIEPSGPMNPYLDSSRSHCGPPNTARHHDTRIQFIPQRSRVQIRNQLYQHEDVTQVPATFSFVGRRSNIAARLARSSIRS